MTLQTQAENPLVSIVVITYNSGEFILELLESTTSQSYPNIELIITDDGSKDETVEICNTWLGKNNHYFIRTELLTVQQNTGIPANCNRGVRASTGEWVKLIAGDDVLHPDCIKLNIEFLQQRGFPSIILFSNMIRFQANMHSYESGKLVVPKNLFIYNDNIPSAIQYEYAIHNYIGNTPTLFISRKVYDDVEYDEEIRFMEDRPFIINATKKGYLIKYLDATTVYYRISEHSVYASKSTKVIFNDFYIKRRPFVYKYIFPNVSLLARICIDIDFYRLKLLDSLGLNKNNFVCRLIQTITSRISPIFLHSKLQLRKAIT